GGKACEPRTWGTTEPLEDDIASDTSEPSIALNAVGNAIAVWNSRWGTNGILSTRYDAVTGWSGEILPIHKATNTAVAQYPKVAIDAAGDGVVVWVQSDGTADSIWANRYVAGTGWSGANVIETDNNAARAPSVASDGAGNAVAVWEQS